MEIIDAPKNLTKSELRRQMYERLGSYLYGRHGGKPKTDRVAHIVAYRRLRAMLNAGKYVEEINKRGNVVHRDVDADVMLGFRAGSRAPYDQRLVANGWQQYDTDQDAPYFGCFVHIERRMTFTYCEGDRTLVICPTTETFQAELEDMARFYGPTPPAFVHVDAENRATAYIIDRPSIPALAT